MDNVLACGFECGTDEAHWSAGSGTFTTSSPISGLRSLRCNSAGGNAFRLSAGTFGVGVVVLRFTIKFTTLPNVDCQLGGILTNNAGVWFDVSDSKIRSGSSAGMDPFVGYPVVAGSICNVVSIVDTRAANWVLPVYVNGLLVSQFNPAIGAASAPVSVLVGFPSNVTADLLYDDILVSTSLADVPLPSVKVLSFVPNADGTHTATGTTIVKGTVASPTGGGNVAGATDVFNWVDARPIGGGATDNTRLVNQQAAGSTLYAEVDFEPTVEANPPVAIDVITVDRQAATQSGGFSTKLNDNGTEDVIITRSDNGVVTDRFVTKHYATMVGGGAWTLARFNALKARFGYSSDATPDQYWRGIMIEAAFPTNVLLPSQVLGVDTTTEVSDDVSGSLPNTYAVQDTVSETASTIVKTTLSSVSADGEVPQQQAVVESQGGDSIGTTVIKPGVQVNASVAVTGAGTNVELLGTGT